MKKFLHVFLIISSSHLLAQNSLFKGNLNWADWEIPLSTELRKIRLDELIKTPKIPSFISRQYTAGANHESFHFIDANSDSEMDVLYNGPVGNSDGIVVFIKSGSTYVLSNTLGGEIIELERSRLSGFLQFKILQNPCCPAEEQYRLVAQLSIRPNDVKLLTSVEYSYKQSTEVPITFFSPKPFVTTRTHYNLRAQPKIDRETNVWTEHIDGNVVAIYPQGSIGKAIAEKTDEKGRLWWFVVMENNIQPTKSLLVYKKPTNMSVGWMSQRFLKEIKP